MKNLATALKILFWVSLFVIEKNHSAFAQNAAPPSTTSDPAGASKEVAPVVQAPAPVSAPVAAPVSVPIGAPTGAAPAPVPAAQVPAVTKPPTEAPAPAMNPPTTGEPNSQAGAPVTPVGGGVAVPVEQNNAPAHSANPAPAEDGEYEIDYEEEPGDSDEESEMPQATKNNHGKKVSAMSPTNTNGGAGGIQGSRAKHRFTPILKSETKSIYQKDGKALDVDSD